MYLVDTVVILLGEIQPWSLKGVRGLNLIYWVPHSLGILLIRKMELHMYCNYILRWSLIWNLEYLSYSFCHWYKDVSWIIPDRWGVCCCDRVANLLIISVAFLNINLSQCMVRHCAVHPDTEVMWQGWKLQLQPKFNLNCKLHDVINQHATFPHNNIFFGYYHVL